MKLDFFKTIRAEPVSPSDWMGALDAAVLGRWPGWEESASKYVAHSRVAEAVNVAIALGKPLLVTGEPGVGKTQLANAVAWQLGLGQPEKFVAKSVSEAKDLFYTYDALARFHAIEVSRHMSSRPSAELTTQDAEKVIGKPDNPLNFIDYNGLGRAILSAHEEADVKAFLLGDQEEGTKYKHPGKPMKSVVLIDEIDKASSDFCNDLLNEIENLVFTVPEVRTQATPAMPSHLRPIVIITSNRERELPAAFLRRCIYTHIPYPKHTLPGEIAEPGAYAIENILSMRLSEEFTYSTFARSLTDFVHQLRGRNLGKAPGTAELIDLMELLAPQADLDKPLLEQPELFDQLVVALAKTDGDAEITRRLFTSAIAQENQGN